MIASAKELEMQASDYRAVERAIFFFNENRNGRPPDAQLAAAAGLDEAELRRLLARWGGISPGCLGEALSTSANRRRLEESRPRIAAAAPALTVIWEETGSGGRGAGLRIAWGVHPSPFGGCLLGVSQKGIVSLNFVPGEDREAAVAGMKEDWPGAEFVEAPEVTGPLAERVFSDPEGLGVFLRGTRFQIRVWRALLDIPMGALDCYSAVAARAGRPDAVRAAASAVGDNPVSYLIPCHRVIRSNGEMSDYRWGRARKQALQLWEATRCGSLASPLEKSMAQ